eukprot:CAMPEP_0184522936 /NCGR_PEP_ID=MMETSP0198_2-20121128/8579_1 /TAXON_ID=1112570 /ORGANISM="Thraustochytrium sp., Strain LLF1b" /LENGTH=480 /DNA_ID=CAMNT_0026913859 /DNA_START=604 /DNA_END=2046 /DNA_ORIENTATION=-
MESSKREDNETNNFENEASDDARSQSSDNDMYNLLDAASMTTSSCLQSNIRNIGSIYEPEGFADAMQNFDASLSFRNAAGILDEYDGHAAFQDVYRSVDIEDPSALHNSAKLGESALDRPFNFDLPVTDKIGVPSPRAFARLPLEHSHLFLVCPVKELVESMSTELVALGADMMYYPSGCFWRAMYYPEAPSLAVDFRIYLNACPDIGNNRYVVEFVRRSGCTMSFNQMFSALRGEFMRKEIVTDAQGDIVRSLKQLPTPFNMAGIQWSECPASSETSDVESEGLPRLALSRCSSIGTDTPSESDDDEFDFGDVSDEDMFKPLYDLSNSTYEDIHVQGLALVSQEAKKPEQCKRMISACPDLLDLVVKRLRESTHPEVRRHCCTTLNAIATNGSLHDHVIDCKALPVLTTIAASDYSPATGETQRQAAAALSNLCKREESRPAVSECVSGMEEVFEQLAFKDQRLAELIGAVHEALQTNE